jgi:RNA polymerase sigma-70 factor (ECF subfamily)
MTDALATFLSVRPRLYRIAYRMLRRASEAEDIVQDVWIRWQAADHRLVRDPAAFLATATTRLAINVIQSARSRREIDLGPWMPEPVDTCGDPNAQAERAEQLTHAIGRLVGTLSPTERVAFILREAFDYPYRDIAAMLELEEPNARQVVTRARARLARSCHAAAPAMEHRRLLESFLAVTRHGKVAEFAASR